MNEDKFIIHVHIGGFPLRLKILRSDEEKYRKAEKEVAKLIEDYYNKFKDFAYEDILKAVAYHFAVLVAQNELSTDPSPLVDRIKSLEAELDGILEQVD